MVTDTAPANLGILQGVEGLALRPVDTGRSAGLWHNAGSPIRRAARQGMLLEAGARDNQRQRDPGVIEDPSLSRGTTKRRRHGLREWLMREQNRLFTRGFAVQVAGNAAVAVAAAVIFSEGHLEPRTAIWLALVLLNAVARVFSWWGLRGCDVLDPVVRRRRLLIAEGLDGLLWGALIASLPFGPGGQDPPFLFVLVTGLAAGPIPFLTVIPGAYALFMVPVCVGFAWRSAHTGGFLSLLPWIVLALSAVAVRVARVNSDNVRARLLGRYRLEHLVARIRRREATVRALIEASPDFIAVFDAEGRWRLANPAVAEVYDIAPGERGDVNLWARLHGIEDPRLRRPLQRFAANVRLAPAREEVSFLKGTSGLRVFDLLRSALPGHAGGGWVVVGRDVTEQRRDSLARQLRDRIAQAVLRDEPLDTALRAPLQAMADHLGLLWLALLRTDTDGLPIAIAQGGTLHLDPEIATRLALAPEAPPERVVCPIRHQGDHYGALVYRTTGELPLAVDAHAWLTRVALEIGAMCQLDAAQDRLRRLAHYDALTGLPNRTLFLHQLRQAIQSAEEDELLHALLFLDLDRFKQINDTLGHAAGDQLLKEVATRLRATVRSQDHVARLSGDEYAVLLYGARSVSEIESLVARMLAVLRSPTRIGTEQITIQGSIGVTLVPFDGADAANLIRHADLAMYEAKRAGRDRWSLFEPKLDSETLERHDLERRLRAALRDEQFVLHFQPQVELATGRVVGVEALLRWADPAALPKSPEVFVPVAEETGLIIPLGEWILREACAQQQRWAAAGLTLQMAINLSPSQFLDPDLYQRVEDALAAGGAAATHIALEITERAAFADPVRARAILDGWRAQGMQCAIDDFGTGQASLAYLTDLPAEVIKIDRVFVQALPDDATHCAIVEGVIRMSHQLGRKVLAEGVETMDQWVWLRSQGCDLAQGFLVAEPMPADRLPGWITQWESRGMRPGRALSGFADTPPAFSAIDTSH